MWAQILLYVRGRGLTQGECALIERLFQKAIYTPRVRVFARPYLPLLSYFNGHAAMSPNGAVYFPSASYRPDFSQAPLAARVWFVHEMVHVWQQQLRYPVRCAGLRLALQGAYRTQAVYQYDCAVLKPFSAYHFEQQAQIIAHYYQSLETNEKGGIAPMQQEFLTQVIEDFRRNPCDVALLPQRA